jgi:hypothetical protein
MSEPRPPPSSRPALAALGAAVAVMAAEGVFASLGGPPAHFTLFLGRFHPLAVHLPIGILLLVVAAEGLTLFPRFRARVDPAVSLVWPALIATAVGALLLGQFLARSGDFPPRILNLHRRLELFAVVGMCGAFAAWSYQSQRRTARARLVYRGVLGFAVLVMSAGAHFGGVMTRGETYLSRYAPGPLKPLFGGGGDERAKPATKTGSGAALEPTLFAQAVAPILEERCTSCHGAEKTKGGLRLDSLEGLLKGGESGPAVTPGAPGESPLLGRVLLPLDDDDHMPPKDKPQPEPGELAILRFWIERGANDKVLLRDTVPPADARALLERALSAAQPGSQKTPRSDPPPPASGAPSGANTATAIAPDPPVSPASSPAPAEPTRQAPARGSAGGGDAPSSEPPSPKAPAAPGARSAEAILRAACESCHGSNKQKAKLRVDSRDALLRGGKSGPAVVPGRPNDSELIRRIRLPLSDEKHMPPDDEPQLSAQDVAMLSAWVRGLSNDGASAAARPAAATRASADAAGVAPESAGSTAEPAATAEAPAETPETQVAATAFGAEPAGAGAEVAEPAVTAAALANLPARLVLFPDAVGPLLVDRCGRCHSGEKPAMGLRVDSHASVLAGGLSGPSVIAGKPEQSLLYERVTLPLNDGDHMPPADEPQLSHGEIALLKLWIERGAAEGLAVNTRELPDEARRAVATRPPRSRGNDAPHAVAAESGGCAACSIGAASAGAASAWGATALLVSLILRRRSVRMRNRPRVLI